MVGNSENDNNIERHYEIKDVSFTSEDDVATPPPPGFTSGFTNLEEWLVNICNDRKPQKPIDTYRFALFERQDAYILCFSGENTYEESKTHTATRIDFAPKDMYFQLPGEEYKNLGREEVLERLTFQLKEFVESDQFKQSFLREAKTITTDWAGEIWSK